jgi:hypothetical protein
LVALVIYATQHARHRPSHGDGQPECKMPVAWGGVKMTGFGDQTRRAKRGN